MLTEYMQDKLATSFHKDRRLWMPLVDEVAIQHVHGCRWLDLCVLSWPLSTILIASTCFHLREQLRTEPKATYQLAKAVFFYDENKKKKPKLFTLIITIILFRLWDPNVSRVLINDSSSWLRLRSPFPPSMMSILLSGLFQVQKCNRGLRNVS